MEVRVIIESFEMLFCVIAFLAPGFILFYIRAKFVPQKQEDTTAFILRYLFYSITLHLLCSPIVYCILKNNYHVEHPFRTLVIAVSLIILLPIIIGSMLGIIQQKGWDKLFFNKIGINTIHTTPTAWDYKFSSIDKHEWIIVTTTENKKFLGYFGSGSFASSEALERDLYFQKLYIRNADDTDWIENGNNAGILIRYDNIKYLEFLKVSDE